MYQHGTNFAHSHVSCVILLFSAVWHIAHTHTHTYIGVPVICLKFKKVHTRFSVYQRILLLCVIHSHKTTIKRQRRNRKTQQQNCRNYCVCVTERKIAEKKNSIAVRFSGARESKYLCVIRRIISCVSGTPRYTRLFTLYVLLYFYTRFYRTPGRVLLYYICVCVFLSLVFVVCFIHPHSVCFFFSRLLFIPFSLLFIFG